VLDDVLPTLQVTIYFIGKNFLYARTILISPLQGEISSNVRHIRSFSEAERKKNLGEKILLSLFYYKVQNF